jgi:hypothetical protein
MEYGRMLTASVARCMSIMQSFIYQLLPDCLLPRYLKKWLAPGVRCELPFAIRLLLDHLYSVAVANTETEQAFNLAKPFGCSFKRPSAPASISQCAPE